MAKARHPLEYLADELREQVDPYARMNENCMLLTNFPKDIKVTQAYIKDLCLQHGDKTAVIDKIVLHDALLGDRIDRRNKVAYAIVEFALPNHLTTVRRGLWKHWIQDKLLKIKTLKDAKNENHGERTIILQGFPSHMDQQDLATAMSGFGAILSIEAPTLDRYVQA